MQTLRRRTYSNMEREKMSDVITADKLIYLYDELVKEASKQKNNPMIVINGNTWLSVAQQCEIIINQNAGFKQKIEILEQQKKVMQSYIDHLQNRIRDLKISALDTK